MRSASSHVASLFAVGRARDKKRRFQGAAPHFHIPTSSFVFSISQRKLILRKSQLDSMVVSLRSICRGRGWLQLFASGPMQLDVHAYLLPRVSSNLSSRSMATRSAGTCSLKLTGYGKGVNCSPRSNQAAACQETQRLEFRIIDCQEDLHM